MDTFIERPNRDAGFVDSMGEPTPGTSGGLSSYAVTSKPAIESDIDDVFEDDHILDVALAEAVLPTSISELSRVEVNIKLVQEICKELSGDQSFPVKLREKFLLTDCMPLVNKVKFLEDCLVPRGRFCSVSKEKAWANYHKAYLEHLPVICGFFECTQASSWFCMRLFNKLVAQKYSSVGTKESTTVNVSESDRDIITYIGGSIVQKLKKRTVSMKDEFQKNARLDCLEYLVLKENPDANLTKTLSRGGLLFLKPAMHSIFLGMEKIFRTLFDVVGERKLGCKAFIAECFRSPLIPNYFHMTTEKTWAHESVKEEILTQMMSIFFKIRAHHKCRSAMDKFRNLKKQSKKEKALRKRLSGPKLQNNS